MGDEHVLGDRLLRDAPHERRLAIAPRGEHDDVLAVQDVGEELLDLGLTVGERLVEGERAVAERIRHHFGRSVASVTRKCVMHVCVTRSPDAAAPERQSGLR